MTVFLRMYLFLSGARFDFKQLSQRFIFDKAQLLVAINSVVILHFYVAYFLAEIRFSVVLTKCEYLN